MQFAKTRCTDENCSCSRLRCEQGGEPERRIGRVLRSTVLGRRRVTLYVRPFSKHRCIVTKPFFTVDIATNAQSSLEAHIPLGFLTDEGCFHNANNLRMPLGIYNVSVSRVCDKLIRLSQRLEAYFKASNTLEPLEESDGVMKELIDYIELSLYAAAEHVDDIDSIASGFFKNSALRNKHVAYKRLQKEIKRHKRLVSAATNAIKHQQSRIRIFSMEFTHGGSSGCLHGYFIEGVETGVVCPSKKFHQSQDVFSITTLIWEIVVFLLNCSRDLEQFLQVVSTQVAGPENTISEIFTKAVIAAARLPIYTFGEEHPFSRVTLHIKSSDNNTDSLESSLYGSITDGWSKTANASFGRFTSRFEGDGKTKSFRFAQPKSVSLHHWS